MSHDVTDFDREVITRSHEVPVLCDFWAPWCGPCRMLGPVLDKLAAQAGGRWILAKVDTERYPEPAQRYQIRGIPAVKLFHRGAVVAEFSGAQSAAMVAQWLEQHLPTLTPPPLRAALPLVESGRFGEAAALLRPALETLTGAAHAQARFLLARAVVWSEPAEALSLLRELPTEAASEREREALRFIAGGLLSEPLIPTEPSALRSHLLAAHGALRRGELAVAMEQFTEILWDNPRYADGQALQWQRALLFFLGPRHPLSRRHMNAYSGALDMVS